MRALSVARPSRPRVAVLAGETPALQIAGWKPAPQGFTLIELMVALFIALIIFTIGFMTISGAITARREAEARIRAAENARVFFQMLEKDLAGAYPLPGSDITTLVSETPVSMTVNGKPVYIIVNGKQVPAPPVTNDRIEMLTRIDHRDVTDQYVFIRYFVNSLGHLCREVNPNPTAAGAVTPFDPTDDTFALFDQTYALLVSPAQWTDATKTMTVGPGYACNLNTTHIQATVYMFGYNGSNAATDNSGATKRVFQKTFAVPDVYRAQP